MTLTAVCAGKYTVFGPLNAMKAALRSWLNKVGVTLTSCKVLAHCSGGKAIRPPRHKNTTFFSTNTGNLQLFDPERCST